MTSTITLLQLFLRPRAALSGGNNQLSSASYAYNKYNVASIRLRRIEAFVNSGQEANDDGVWQSI